MIRVSLLALLVLPFAITACGNDIGNDPCLLQQYQSHGMAIASHLSSALSNLPSSVDALQGPRYTIGSSQADISETLTTIVEFQNTVDAQRSLLDHSAQASAAAPFVDDMHRATSDLDTASWMLIAAYTDLGRNAPRAAQTIAAQARVYMRRGRLEIDSATTQLSVLNTNSVNC